MGLKYLYPTDGKKACSTEPLKVKLDGRHVGEIRKVKDGFQYYPKGQKTGGVVFSKVSEVQNSLALSQPTKAEKKEEAVGTDDEIMAQAKKGLKRLEKENKSLNGSLDAASAFLTSICSLLNIQAESVTAVNVLEETIDHEGTKYDGHSLLGEIAEYLESL